MSEALNAIHWIMKDFCEANKLKLETEFKFHPTRRWRFDYAIPTRKLAIEYNGGIFMRKSGHSNVKGQSRDQEKMNQAQILGWKVLQYSAMNYQTIEEDLKNIL